MTTNVNGTITLNEISDIQFSKFFELKHNSKSQFGVILNNIQTSDNGVNSNIILHFSNIEELTEITKIINLIK